MNHSARFNTIFLQCTVLIATLLFLPKLSLAKYYEFQGPGELIEVNVQLQHLVPPASLWIQTRNADTGQVQTQHFSFKRKLATRLLPTQAEDYFILRTFLQLENGVEVDVCHVDPTRLIHRQVTVLNFRGVLDAREALPHCDVSYRDAMPISAQAMMAKPLRPEGRAGTRLSAESYLKALINCTTGVYGANLDNPFLGGLGQENLSILGVQNQRCVIELTRTIENTAGLSETLSVKCQLPAQAIATAVTEIEQVKADPTIKTNPWGKLLCSNCQAQLGTARVQCAQTLTS